MSKDVIDVLNWFATKLGMTIDWTSESVMPIVQEMIGKYAHYTIFKSTVGLVICLLLSVVLIIVGIKSFKAYKKKSWNECYFAMMLFSGIVLCLAIAIAAVNVIEIGKAITIPEIVFIEQVQYLIK